MGSSSIAALRSRRKARLCKMMTRLFTAFLLAGLCYCTQAEVGQGKNIGIFNVVKFPNEPCNSGGTKNGTCYTSEECESKKGKSEGSCAEGYGVCCVFSEGCGDVTAENGTYFESSAGLTGACNLRVCKCQTDICQMRLDFMTFVIHGPSTADATVGEILAGDAIAATKGTDVTAQTQCQEDQFSVTSPGGISPPVICGTNTGYHMYVDASDSCNTLSFQLSTTTFTRSWAIQITQYSCTYNNLAPQGCTQYFFGSTTGTLETFNWANKVHLANQDQAICIRRERNTCQVCYSAAANSDFLISGMDTNAQFAACGSVGVNDANAGKLTNIDRLIIPAPENEAGVAVDGADSAFCGAELGNMADDNDATICSKRLPFMVRFQSDGYEFAGEFAAGQAAMMSHQGFTISYKLNAC